MADKTPVGKMLLVNLEGPAELLDETILSCAESLVFPEGSPQKSGRFTGDDNAEKQNPYQRLLEHFEKISDNAQIPLVKREIHAITTDHGEISAFADTFLQSFSDLQHQLEELGERLAHSRNLLVHLQHMTGFSVAFQALFSCQYIKIRLGRLPADSQHKLTYYSDHIFLFFPFSRAGAYIWGLYLAPNALADEVDDIFSALFFERVRIPPDLTGTPQDAQELLKKRVQEEAAALSKMREQFARLTEENRARFLRYYNEARFLCRMYETRRYASIFSDRFYMTGFIPRDGLRPLEERARALGDVTVELVSRT